MRWGVVGRGALAAMLAGGVALARPLLLVDLDGPQPVTLVSPDRPPQSLFGGPKMIEWAVYWRDRQKLLFRSHHQLLAFDVSNKENSCLISKLPVDWVPVAVSPSGEIWGVDEGRGLLQSVGSEGVPSADIPVPGFTAAGAALVPKEQVLYLSLRRPWQLADSLESGICGGETDSKAWMVEELYSVKLRTGEVERISFGSAPCVNPEGTLLAFCRCGALVVRNLLSGKERSLEPARDVKVVLDPDDFFSQGGASRFAVVSWAAGSPTFSPDGKKIAYLRKTRGGATSLRIVEGATLREIRAFPAGEADRVFW